MNTSSAAPRLDIPPLTISGIYVRSIVDILESLGFAVDAGLDILDVTLDDMDDPRLRLSAEKLRALFDAAQDDTGNALIGLETGFRFRVANYTRTGSILAYAPSLRVAGEMNALYAPLVETIGLTTLSKTPTSSGERVSLRWIPEFDDDDPFRHVTELIVGGYAATVRWLSWAMDAPAPRVSFRHGRPKATSTMSHDRIDALYMHILQGLPEFRSAHNDLVLPAETVDAELPTHSPVQFAQQKRKLDAVLFGSPRAQSGSAAVLRDILRTRLADGVTTREGLAEAAGISVSALDKRLAAEDMTFRTLLDSVRQDGFSRLSSQGVKLAEIAHELGFNDQAAMTRAFKRWYGTTPGRHLSAI